MLEFTTTLTALHFVYLAGVIVILAVMMMRRDTPLVCILFLFLLGLTATGTIAGGIQTIFNAALFAAKEFMEIIAVIALVTALSKLLADLGSDRLMMKPFAKIMCSPSAAWWILGLMMMVFSFFLWPSPSVALIGAIMLPIAVQKGLQPLAAAIAMNLFGHGIALSYDLVIQGAPAVSAAAAGIDTAQVVSVGSPLFITMGVSTVTAAFLLNRKRLAAPEFHTSAEKCSARGTNTAVNTNSSANADIAADTHTSANPTPAADKTSETQHQHTKSPNTAPATRTNAARFIALLTPIAFAGDILLMFLYDLKGGDAASLVSGTAALLMVLGSLLGFGKQSPEKVTDYLIQGFSFAIRIFAPVILIGGFFFLGGEGINTILKDSAQSGLLNDWAVWLAGKTPLNPYLAALLQMVIGALTGLDGSGFSGLPLTGALSRTFSLMTGGSIPIFAALGQITAIFVGGGTIVPWGLIPVAAICNVDPIELTRRNLPPVLIGFACTFLLACFLL